MSRGIRLVMRRHGSDSMLLPRPYSYLDGETAAFGISLNAECMDPLFVLGVEIGATPDSLVGRALVAVSRRRGGDW